MLGIYLARQKYGHAPEGKEPLEKILSLAKYGIFGSLFVASYDCAVRNQTQTVLEALNVTAYYMIPTTAMFATYAAATYLAANIREEDDLWNHVVGSIATAPIYQAWRKNALQTLYVTKAIIFGGIALKLASYKPGVLVPPMYRVTDIGWDFDLTRDPDIRSTWNQ